MAYSLAGEWTEVLDHCDSLSPDQADALIQAWRAAFTEHQITRRGPPPGITHRPEFLDRVVENAWSYRDKEQELPNADTLAGLLGVSRTAYFAWQSREGVTLSDVHLAADCRTILDGVSLLRGLQQKNRGP
jgi:hypothetical protein